MNQRLQIVGLAIFLLGSALIADNAVGLNDAVVVKKAAARKKVNQMPTYDVPALPAGPDLQKELRDVRAKVGIAQAEADRLFYEDMLKELKEKMRKAEKQKKDNARPYVVKVFHNVVDKTKQAASIAVILFAVGTSLRAYKFIFNENLVSTILSTAAPTMGQALNAVVVEPVAEFAYDAGATVANQTQSLVNEMASSNNTAAWSFGNALNYAGSYAHWLWNV